MTSYREERFRVLDELHDSCRSERDDQIVIGGMDQCHIPYEKQNEAHANLCRGCDGLQLLSHHPKRVGLVLEDAETYPFGKANSANSGNPSILGTLQLAGWFRIER